MFAIELFGRHLWKIERKRIDVCANVGQMKSKIKGSSSRAAVFTEYYSVYVFWWLLLLASHLSENHGFNKVSRMLECRMCKCVRLPLHLLVEQFTITLRKIRKKRKLATIFDEFEFQNFIQLSSNVVPN